METSPENTLSFASKTQVLHVHVKRLMVINYLETEPVQTSKLKLMCKSVHSNKSQMHFNLKLACIANLCH